MTTPTLAADAAPVPYADTLPDPMVAADGRLSVLNFADLRRTNVARCEEVFHPVADWSPSEWSNAMAGECGEACNLTKKLKRGEDIDPRDIADELADAVIYADLVAARLGIDLGTAIVRKFNAVSLKVGSGKGFLHFTESDD